jgi:hypothetical protein
MRTQDKKEDEYQEEKLYRIVSVSLRPRFTPGKGPRYLLDTRLDGPHRVSTQRREEKSFASAGDRTPVVQPVVTLYY